MGPGQGRVRRPAVLRRRLPGGHAPRAGASPAADTQPWRGEVCGRLRAHAIGTTVSVPDGSKPSFTGALLGLAGAAPACLGQINTQMYGPEALTSGRQAVSIAAHTLSTRIWMSEFGIGGVASDTASGLTYSSVIAADMRWLRPPAWVNWQAVEARGGWGLLESPTWPREGPVTRTKRFSALAQ